MDAAAPRSHSRVFYEPYALATGEAIGPPSDYEEALYQALLEETQRLYEVQEVPFEGLTEALAYTRCAVRFVRAERLASDPTRALGLATA